LSSETVAPPAARIDATPNIAGVRPAPVIASIAPGRAPPRQGIRLGLFLLLPLVLIVGAYGYVTGGQVISMNDAYVEAEKVGVSTDVPGIVKDVEVRENQHVEAGQILYRLNDASLRFALQRADAQVGMIGDQLNAVKASYGDMQTQIAQAEYDVSYYTTEAGRQQDLLNAHVASQATFDTARRNLENAKQKLASLNQQLAGIGANLNGAPSGPVETNPRYQEAVAQRDEVARELGDTVVRAPFAGIVTDVTAIAPGKYLPASTTAFYLIASDRVWVDAQPKETELTHVREGQSAKVTVDTYPGKTWQGTVQSISPAAAQEFSLLPAQNSSGNWVKVVQRVPLRVRIDTHDKSLPPLRAGMSAEVEVDTGHARGLPRFLTALFGGPTQAN
jgi:membrane fusion protein (multidrug efflux system)